MCGPCTPLPRDVSSGMRISGQVGADATLLPRETTPAFIFKELMESVATTTPQLLGRMRASGGDAVDRECWKLAATKAVKGCISDLSPVPMSSCGDLSSGKLTQPGLGRSAS